MTSEYVVINVVDVYYDDELNQKRDLSHEVQCVSWELQCVNYHYDKNRNEWLSRELVLIDSSLSAGTLFAVCLWRSCCARCQRRTTRKICT